MKKCMISMLLPMLLVLVSSPVWANTSKLNTQEKQLLGKWLCQYDYKGADFASRGYYHVEYLADKTYVQHEVAKLTTEWFGEAISGMTRYGSNGDWWIEDGRIYDRPVELFKFEYDPRLGAIPYWVETAQPDGSVYDERITQLTRTQLITLQRIDEDEAEMVCQRL